MDYYIQPNQQESGGPEKTEHETKGQPTGAIPLQSQPEEPTGPPIGGILAGVLGVFSIAAAYGWITGSWDAEQAIPIIIVVLVGGVVAYFGEDSFGYTLLTIETVGAVLLWIYAAIIDFFEADSLILWIFTDLVLGLIVTIPLCVFPALVCAILVTIIKMISHAFKVKN